MGVAGRRRGVTLKRREWREGNKENVQNGNGNHANSDTNGGERKLGPTVLQLSHISTDIDFSTLAGYAIDHI